MRNGGRCKVGVFVLVAALLLGACGGDDGADEGARATVPESTTTSTESTTTTSSTVPAPEFEPLLADPALTPEEQVEAAYLFSWDIYLDAVERGDPSFLHLVYADRALDVVEEEVATFLAERQRQIGSADLNYAVTIRGADEAAVLDLFTDRLEIVDAATGEVVVPAPNEVVDFMFEMQLLEGSWFVTHIVEYTEPS